MANKKPLVETSGEQQQLQSSDTLVDTNSALPFLVNPIQADVDDELLTRLNLAILQ